jgi:hypothetical protein
MTREASHFTHKVNEIAGYDDNYMLLMFFKDLSPAAQALVGVWELCQEVHNGGFFQYMHNSSGERAPTMCAILKEIGAEDIAALVGCAIKIVSSELRSMSYFDALNRLSQEEKGLLDAADDELLSQEEQLSCLLLHYLAKHSDELDAPNNFWKELTIQ